MCAHKVGGYQQYSHQTSPLTTYTGHPAAVCTMSGLGARAARPLPAQVPRLWWLFPVAVVGSVFVCHSHTRQWWAPAAATGARQCVVQGPRGTIGGGAGCHTGAGGVDQQAPGRAGGNNAEGKGCTSGLSLREELLRTIFLLPAFFIS